MAWVATDLHETYVGMSTAGLTCDLQSLKLSAWVMVCKYHVQSEGSSATAVHACMKRMHWPTFINNSRPERRAAS